MHQARTEIMTLYRYHIRFNHWISIIVHATQAMETYFKVKQNLPFLQKKSGSAL